MKVQGDKAQLRVLCLEDSAPDTELLRETLRAAGFDLEMDCAATEKEFVSFLRGRPYDIILADYKVPGFDAFGALRLTRKIHSDVPFICVSGSIGEENAVELLKQGAVDYVFKEQLIKLPGRIKRAVAEAREKQALYYAGKALQDSETRYRRLFEAARDGILILDAESGAVVDVNPFLSGMLGFSHEQFVGKKIWELRTFGDIIANASDLIKLLQKGYIRFEDKPLETAAGKKIEVEFISYAYEVNRHKIIQCNIRDITERKRAEKMIQSLSSRQESILSAVPDIIMEVDANKVYNWANRTGLDFFGDDVIGKEARHYFEGDQETYTIVQPLFTGDENVVGLESWQRRKDGEKRLLAWRCRVLKDESGNVIGALSAAQDITERRQAEQLVESQNNLLNALINSPGDMSIFSLDTGYCYTTFNKKHQEEMKRVWGADIKIGMNVLDCMRIPALRAASKQSIDHALRGEIFSEVHHQGDPEAYYEFIWNPIFQKSVVIGVAAFIHDITGRLRAEDEIRGLARFPAENPNPVLRISQNGALLYVNEAGLKQLPEWNLAAGNQVSPALGEIVTAALTSGATQKTEFECGDRCYSFYITPIAEAGYANLYGFDITERRRAEVEIKNRVLELERFHRLAVGRELKMIELKQEINELTIASGLTPPHPLKFLQQTRGYKIFKTRNPLQETKPHEKG